MNYELDRNGHAFSTWHVEDRFGANADPWFWGTIDTQDEVRREAERRAAHRRSRRAQLDWLRNGGFVILNPLFTLNDLKPRALSAWLIRSYQDKGDFPLVSPLPRRRHCRPHDER